MTARPGKNFIVGLLAVLLAVGGLASFSSNRTIKDASPVQAQTVEPSRALTQSAAQPADSAAEQSSEASPYQPSPYEEGYRAGYRDAQRDCAVSPVAASSYSRRTSYAPRRRVAGVRYYGESRRGHSTRDMILTIAAPAAIGAGVGALAGGKKGAGAGALLGGGGGALYYLIKNRRR